MHKNEMHLLAYHHTYYLPLKYGLLICLVIFLALVVDIITGEVVSIDDLPCHTDFKAKPDNPVPVPATPNNYDPDFLPPESIRKDVKLLEVIQPEGPSFAINGNEISWQKYKIRVR